MASGSKLFETTPVRMMVVGYPGAGKTGALASLVNAGFKLRVLAFDKKANMLPIFKYSDKDKWDNIDVAILEDQLRANNSCTEVMGRPEAFVQAHKLMDEWKYTEDDGTEVDLGCSSEWGMDTIVVLDSLTAMGRAAMRRALSINNRTPANTRDRDWGFAMNEQEAFIEKLTSSRNGHHVIVLSHLKMIAPKEPRKGESQLATDIKERMADLIPTRLFPSALGHQLPQQIGQHFPTLVLAEARTRGRKTERRLFVEPRQELDLKIPAPELVGKDFPIETGMVDIFDALTGGVENCLNKPATT